MKNGHLVGFDAIEDFEESPEMEAPKEDLDGLSERQVRDIEYDFIKSHKRCKKGRMSVVKTNYFTAGRA